MLVLAHHCLLLIVEVLHVIIQLYKLISLLHKTILCCVARCAIRKAKSGHGFLINGCCGTRFVMEAGKGIVKPADESGCWCLGCEAAERSFVSL